MMNEQQHKEKTRRIIPWVFVLFWMGLIFYFSSQPVDQSVGLSMNTMVVFVRFIKIIQVFIFFLFAVWSVRKLNRMGITIGFKELLLIGIVAVVLYYFSVELRGMLVPADLHRFVRKNAHFFIFLVLGILVKHALSKNGISGLKGILLSLLICVLYAVLDEVHQRFVPGRQELASDVLIDSLGAGTGIGFHIILNKIKRKKIAKFFSHNA